MRNVWDVEGLLGFGIVAGALMIAAPAAANETTAYEYDALGRLTKTATTGGANNGLKTEAAFDPAGNRSNYKVEGATGSPRPSGAVIVIPLNGFTVIPIGRRNNFGL